MANEYLKRTPTSTGNRRVWTTSLWYKMSSAGGFFGAGDGSNAGNSSHWWFNSDQLGYSNNDGSNYVTVLRKSRDFSSWSHYMLVVDTTKVEPYDRVVFYENGVRNEVDTTSGYTNPSRNAELSWINQLYAHHIGARNRAGANTFSTGEYCDFFFIDGQALTPDVFGFYKQGKGYISVGSTQATDFRPGQWVPKTPRVIKTEINRRGGFGVNGFYLPMNDSNNFGADFHCTPNSIIKLQENLPQPKCRIDGVGDYTGSLREDPFKQYLVLALPFVSGGLQSGFGDYSAAIKGSGTAKTLILTNGSVTPSIGNTGVYYGSGGNFPGGTVGISTSTDFKMDGSFTVESWFFSNNFNSGSGNHIAQYRNGQTGEDNWVLSQGSTGGSSVRFLLRNDNGTNAADLNVTNTGITINQWYHFAGVYDHPNRRATVYLNGAAVGINTNVSWTRDNGTTLLIGSNDSNPTGVTGNRNINGYLQDLRIYKGVAKYTGGFDVPRPYTPVGIATFRAVPDTCLNNFCTWNPLYPVLAGSNSTYVNGNLTVSDSTANGSQVSATIGVSTGKWYYEALPTTVSGGSHLIGIRPAEWFTENSQNRTAYRSDGPVYNDAGGAAQSGTTYTSNDIIGIAFDMNNRRLWFSKNGSWVYSGDPNNNSNPAVSFASTYTNYTPAAMFDNVAGTQVWNANFGQNPTFSGNTTAGTYTDSNGKGLFKYEPPSGFLALCEDNLPTPAISDPGKHFKTVLYTGDGNNGRSIVGVGFTPDLVWIKKRAGAIENHNLFDSVRGANIYLQSNTTGIEAAAGIPMLTSFNNDGFSLGSNGGVNESTHTFAAWCWRAGAGTTSTNTNGSITSVVSVNQDAGFSIVSYTGNGVSNATVGHGLGKVPAFGILKCRDTNSVTNTWRVHHKAIPGNFLYLNLTDAQSLTSSTSYGSLGTFTSSSTVTLQAGSVDSTMPNENTKRYIMYLWAEIEGFSKFGSYVGNGSADGPFVFTNGKPAFIMIKRTDSTNDWVIFDSSRTSINPANAYLEPNTSDIETTDSGAGSRQLDILSNGFKLRDTAAAINASGGTYIFAAYAESPFQTANAK